MQNHNFVVYRKRSSSMRKNSVDKKISRLKTILIGDAYVGKTSILQVFMSNKFTTDYKCTIGVDFWVKSIYIDDITTVDLQIWDTCGQERFKTITRQYYSDTHGCILVFDLTKRKSFLNLEIWIDDLKNFGRLEMTILLIGNKSDLIEAREVSKEEIDLFLKKYNYEYLEVSALTGDNVKLCFETIAKGMVKQHENNLSPKRKFKIDNRNVKVGESVELKNEIKKDKKNTKCC